MDGLNDIVNKIAYLTVENITLQKKLDITMKAFDDIEEFRKTGWFGLNFDVWQIICKARAEIEKIK